MKESRARHVKDLQRTQLQACTFLRSCCCKHCIAGLLVSVRASRAAVNLNSSLARDWDPVSRLVVNLGDSRLMRAYLLVWS